MRLVTIIASESRASLANLKRLFGLVPTKQINLSDEHLFWEFVTEAHLAVDLLTAYSGGKVSDALQLCVDATAPANGTQALLLNAFGSSPQAENESTMDDSTEKDINEDDSPGDGDSNGDDSDGDDSTGDDNAVDDSTGDDSSGKDPNGDDQATWGSPQDESEDECNVLSACLSDPCREPKVDACQLTGYVEKLECKGTGTTTGISLERACCSVALTADLSCSFRVLQVTLLHHRPQSIVAAPCLLLQLKWRSGKDCPLLFLCHLFYLFP